jgi:hypothetical protein
MATQILGSDHRFLFQQSTDVYPDTNCDVKDDATHEMHNEDGNVFRGFFFAMLFNIILFLTGAAVWELWRLTR